MRFALLMGTFVRAAGGTNRVAGLNLPEQARVRGGARAHIFVAAGSAVQAAAAVYRPVPATRGMSENGHPAIHLPAAEQGRPWPFATKSAYFLFGKLKNAEEEVCQPEEPVAPFSAFLLIFIIPCPTLHPRT